MAGSVIANLKIMLSASWSKLSSDFAKASKTVRGFGKQVRSGMSAATASFGALGGAAGSLIAQLTNLVSTLTSLGPIALAVATSIGILVAAFSWSAWGASLATETEQASVAMRTMLGDAEHAAAVIQELKRFAAETPFQKADLIDAGKQLAAFQFQAGDIVPTLRMLGDVSALIGAPIGEMAELFGKAKVQGRLFMEDINQFQGRGVPIMQALADEMGTTTLAIREMVSEGQVGFNELYRAFQSLTEEGGKFHNGMIDQAQTMAGLWSTVKDSFAELAELAGEVWLPVLKEAAKWTIYIVRNVVEGQKQILKLAGWEFKDLTETIKNLPRESFDGATNGLKVATDVVAAGVDEIKQQVVDVQKIARDVQGMRFGSSVGAYAKNTSAGFSAVEAAKRTVAESEKKKLEMIKRVLDAIDANTLATRESAVKVKRRSM